MNWKSDADRAVFCADLHCELERILWSCSAFGRALCAVCLNATQRCRLPVRRVHPCVDRTVALLRHVIQVPRNASWFVFAFGYIAAIKLIAALLHRLFTGVWPHFGDTRVLVLLIATIISTPAQSGEEIGWRGYALPRLAARIGLARAGVVLGVIWALWHLPFFFIQGTDKSGQSFSLYLLQVTALSVAIAWLYWRTNESLLIVMLMHAAVNNMKDIVPSAVNETTKAFALNASLAGWITVAVLWICAVYFLIQMRNQKFQGPQLSATP